MFNALALYPSDVTMRFDTIEALASAWEEGECIVWVDVDGPDEEAITELGRVFELDAEALDDCMHGTPPPEVDEYEQHMFIIFYGALAPGDSPAFSPCKLAVFMGSTFLITVHEEPVRSILALWQRCEKYPAHVLKRGVDHLLHTLIDSIVDNYALVVDDLDNRLDALEDQSLLPSVKSEVLNELSDVKRDIMDLRRIVASQRALMEPIARGEYDYISDELEVRFRHVQAHLTATLELVDGLRELAFGIRENYNAALANRLNDIMKTLTLFASVLMPLTLISGLYGMNVPIPAQDNPVMFWLLIAVMAVIGGAMFVFFRFLRWM